MPAHTIFSVACVWVNPESLTKTKNAGSLSGNLTSYTVAGLVPRAPGQSWARDLLPEKRFPSIFRLP